MSYIYGWSELAKILLEGNRRVFVSSRASKCSEETQYVHRTRVHAWCTSAKK